MKIYFAGAIRGGREDQARYQGLIQYLSTLGEVLTEHIGQADLAASGEKGFSDRAIYLRDQAWLEQADVVVAEVSLPSLGVGYEIGYAERRGKKILCLFWAHAPRKLSAMIAGNPALQVAAYTDLTEAQSIIQNFLRTLQKVKSSHAKTPRRQEVAQEKPLNG